MYILRSIRKTCSANLTALLPLLQLTPLLAAFAAFRRPPIRFSSTMNMQRGDAEMENRLNRLMRACIELGDANPIISLHDQVSIARCIVPTVSFDTEAITSVGGQDRSVTQCMLEAASMHCAP